MSLLRHAPYKRSNLHFLLEAVPNPANRPALEEAQKQMVVLQKIRHHASDLFQPNPAVEKSSGGEKSFHSSQLYKMSSSAEELMQAMGDYDVVLRANAILDGGATAVQIGKEDLKQAIASPGKTVELSAGNNANLRVSLLKRGGLHYIRKLDYFVK